MKIAFIVDYTTDDNGNFKVYELQDVLASNLHKIIQVNIDKGMLAYQFYRSLPNDLNEVNNFKIKYKAQQRALLQQYPETAQYNPDFMIINRGSKDPLNDQEIAKIKGFLLKHNNKVVIKTEDVLGNGNIFTNDMGVEAILDVINDALAKGRPFVIEQQEMLTRTRHDELERFNAKHQQADKTGIVRRDLVIYDTETSEIEYFEVYKQVLDTDVTTDNHRSDQDDSIYSKSKGYLETFHTIDDIRAHMKAKIDHYPDRYAKKEQFFFNLACALVEGSFQPQDNMGLENENILTEEDRVTTIEKHNEQKDESMLPIDLVKKTMDKCGDMLQCYGLNNHMNKLKSIKTDGFVDNLI